MDIRAPTDARTDFPPVEYETDPTGKTPPGSFPKATDPKATDPKATEGQ